MKSKKSIRPAPSKVFQKIKIRRLLSGNEAKAVSAVKSLLQKEKSSSLVALGFLWMQAVSLYYCFGPRESNDGLKVPEFQTIRKSARTSFDTSVYNSPVDTHCLHPMVHDTSKRSELAEPTAFHHHLDEDARNGFPQSLGKDGAAPRRNR